MVSGKTFNWQLISFRFCYYQQSIYWGVSTCQRCDSWTPQQCTKRKEMIQEHRGELSLTAIELLFSALSVLCQNLCFQYMLSWQGQCLSYHRSTPQTVVALDSKHLGFALPQEQTQDPMDSHGSFVCHSETRMWPPYSGIIHINKHSMMTMKMLDFDDT